MNKKIMTYSIKPETIDHIRKLAELDGRSASNYLDALIKREYELLFAPEAEAEKFDQRTETPAGS